MALQLGVINLSDGNIQFPKVTTDYSQATEAQVAAELAPFALGREAYLLPSRVVISIPYIQRPHPSEKLSSSHCSGWKNMRRMCEP